MDKQTLPDHDKAFSINATHCLTLEMRNEILVTFVTFSNGLLFSCLWKLMSCLIRWTLIIKQGKTVVKPYYPYTHNYLNICPKMLFVGIPFILCHWEHLQLHIKITKLVIWRTKIIVVVIYECGCGQIIQDYGDCLFKYMLNWHLV